LLEYVGRCASAGYHNAGVWNYTEDDPQGCRARRQGIHRSANISLLSLVFAASMAGWAAAGPCPVGDLNADCTVDARDLQVLAGQWLQPSCAGPGCTDLDNANGINFVDFALLAENWLESYSQVTLAINEFMAKNDATLTDPDGDFDDWIEIYNYGDKAVDMGGMYLTDDLSEPDKWRIPDNNAPATTIGPYGFLLIWADDEANEGTLHAEFKLSTDGEEIGLYDAAGNPIDSIIFGAQNADESYGRVPDGGETWQVFSSATPGKSNTGQVAGVTITEIMYHPYHGLYEPEDLGQEYIELLNRGAHPVNLAGWRFSDGVDFVFGDVTLAAGEYLVVAANVNAFTAAYRQADNITGGWTGRLSNGGEAIELTDAQGKVIDRVPYADEGDWAARELGPEDHGHRGWMWSDAHDGGGKSLELINPALGNEYGQNWAASEPNGGTPGTKNSVADNDIAPLILEVTHSPTIPRSDEQVTVTAHILDEQNRPVEVTLYYRMDGEPNFVTVPMFDDGYHEDEAGGDTIYGGQIPPHENGAIIEFHVEARDIAGNTRTWPAPAMVDGLAQQVANLLYQVDNSYNTFWNPGGQPIYYLIMKAQDNEELQYIGAHTADSWSDAQMNGTFISVDGVDVKLCYNVGIRNRGKGSRDDPPMNYRVNFAHDRPWKEITALNINSKYAYSQVAGSALWRMAGLPAADATAVQVRVNGQNLAESGVRMYGSYAALEVLDSDWAEHHFPEDGNGNLYRCGEYTNGREADLDYEGEDPNAYRDAYFKKTNEADDDWSDLIQLTYVLDNAPDDNFVEQVGQVLHLQQWLRYLAVDSLLGNLEGGLNYTGRGDDYALYRGLEDPRFMLVPHDLDTLMGQGGRTPDPDRSILDPYRGVAGLERMLSRPDTVPMYYRQFLDLIDTVFAPENFDPFLDRLLGDWVPSSRVDDMKQFMAERIPYVLAPIPQEFAIQCDLPLSGEYYYTTADIITLDGAADATKTRSVLVNGRPADWDGVTGRWSLGETSGFLTETLVSPGSVWKYLDDGTDQGTLWREPGFDDTAWPSGQAQLGYGDGDEDTVISYGDDPDNKYPCYYFRHSFNVTDPAAYDSLHLLFLRDDGCVIYLNGAEIARSNMPDGDVTFKTPASGGTSGAEEDAWHEFTVDPALLTMGTNVLAAEIHQVNATSSDISFDLELLAHTKISEPIKGVALNPGINRIIVQAFDGTGATGQTIDSGYIDVWYDTGATNDYPKPVASNDYSDAASTNGSNAQANLLARDSYLPGIPVLVRVELLQDDGKPDRNIWDAVANLSVDNPTVSMSTDSVALRNGLGSALVTFTGAGDFTLTAQLNGLQDSRFLQDLTAEPVTEVSGILTGPATSWSGVIHVTEDLLVPVGHTLTVQLGTLVLLDGVESGSDGTDIDIEGKIESLGTADSPVTFTAFDPATNWGEIHHEQAEPSTYEYANITRAGRSPGGGHTGTGPAVRAVGSQITFEHVCISDNAGKIMHASSGADLTFDNSLFARSVMGPEIYGTALLFEDSWIMQMRAADDADGIYIHGQQPGQLCSLIRGVAVGMDDDGIDTLGSEVIIEDFVVRDCKDKGISVYGGQTDIERSLIVENNNAPEDPTVASVAAKSHEAATTIVNIDHTTIVTSKTQGYVDVGIQSHNKYGVTSGTIIYNVTNSIIDATDPVDVQAPYSDSDIHISYSNVYGEAWPGLGNMNADPMFVDPANHNYRLLGTSPCIDAGDPAAEPDPDLTMTDQGYYFFDQASQQPPPGPWDPNTVWTAEQGPYRVTDELTIPSGITLTIQPGTTVFFDPNARMVVEGGLIAEGTEYNLIRFTRTPGTGDAWRGLQFKDSAGDNRILYAVIEHGQTNDGMVGLENSNLLLDHVTLDNTVLRRIRTIDSSLTVRNCEFTDTCPAGQTPTDNRSEHIWGRGILTGGRFVVDDCVFGITPGHNDAIDFNGPSRPNPIPQILNNMFLGGGDEALDLETDAHIEGNVFAHYHKDAYNHDAGESNVISAGGAKHYVVVRNVFYDLDHVTLVKDGAFMTFTNNTVVDVNKAAIYFDLAGQTRGPGLGAEIDGCIFWNTSAAFDEVTPETALTVNRSLVPTQWHDFGQGNLDADPLFVDSNADLHLKSMSPAIGAGPCGLDMGAYVPSGAATCGEPHKKTHRTGLVLTVGGPGITHYKYSLNDANGPWSAERSVDVPILLLGLDNGQSYTVYVLGKNSAGVWQDLPTASHTWTVDVSYRRLVINEVLARNVQTLDHEGTLPDLVELYYDGPAQLSLAGMSMTDNPAEPEKFVFSNGAYVDPDQYIVLYADASATTPGIHLGFALDADGDSIYLYDADGRLLDSVRFGLQLADLSIGRMADGNWHLTIPTFGQANVAQPLGDPDRLRINEWLAQGAVLFENDFIELFNPCVFPVDLSSLYLTDNPVTQPDKHKIGPLNFIAGGGFAVFTADRSDSPGHVNFRLSADQEIIGLFDSELHEIDKVLYGPQTVDVSEGRAPDGDKRFAFFELPTPGVANPVTQATAVTLVTEDAAKRVLIPTTDIGDAWKTEADFNDANWAACTGPPGGVGFDTRDDYDSYFSLDVQEQMHNHNATCYSRIPFSISGQPSSFSEIELRVRYDDGFVAYLNGTEVARRNFAGVPQWNSSADASHSDAVAVLFEDIDISEHLDTLQHPDNILAIHGLNTSAAHSDFLISVELVATATSSQDQLLANALALLDGLRVTELMYHAADGSDYDFVELQNIGDVTLELTGVRFVEGVTFTFGQTLLGPGEYIVVASDVAAFRSEYGTAIPLAGQYSGNLSNGGENVVLKLPLPLEAAILRFAYQDTWYPDTDGAGKSLTILDPLEHPSAWNDAQNWLPADPTPGQP